MNISVIAGIEFIAFIASLIAVIYASMIYRETYIASPIWFFALTALIALTVLRLCVTIEWLNIYVDLMEQLELAFIFTSVSFWLGFSFLTRVDILKPV